MSNLANLKNNFLKNFYIGDTADMSIQDDLNDFFKFKNIKAPEIAAQCNLYIKKSDIGEFKYLSFGNHTWSHPLMTCLDFYKQEEEILKAHKYLEEVEISPMCLVVAIRAI